jgi:hypothetical protein
LSRRLINCHSGSTTYNTASPDWTEIDTFEVDSAGPYTIRSNIFDWWSGNPNTNYHELTSNEQTGSLDFAADYYVFGTIWNETAVTTFINGTQFWSSLYHPTSWPHNFVNIWASTIGTYEINDSALPSQSSVDYIRYYQKDYVGFPSLSLPYPHLLAVPS